MIQDAAIRIGSTRQLFLDDRVVEQTENVFRQLHRPVRHEGNPIIVADNPWENVGNVTNLSGGTVFFDEEDGHFKMWYRTTDMPMKSMERWRGRHHAGGLAGKPVRLRFHLHHAALYSSQFTGAQTKPTIVNLLGTGNRGRPKG